MSLEDRIKELEEIVRLQAQLIAALELRIEGVNGRHNQPVDVSRVGGRHEDDDDGA